LRPVLFGYTDRVGHKHIAHGGVTQLVARPRDK
jgi:hypothetical protein